MKRSKRKPADENPPSEKAIRLLALFFVFFLVGFFIFFAVVSRPPHRPTSVKIFFYSGEDLKPVARALPAGEDLPLFSMDRLLAGPTQKEKKEGLITLIPAGTKLLGIVLEDGVVFVNLNSSVGDYGGGTSRIQGIISQIVYTLTDLPGVKKVGFLIEGKARIAIGGEGYVIEKPLGRSDLKY